MTLAVEAVTASDAAIGKLGGMDTPGLSAAVPWPRPAVGVRRRLVVALANDHELVVRGLARMLERYADRVVIAEVVAGVRVLSDVDITLYDSFSRPRVDAHTIGRVRGTGGGGKVVVYSWNVSPQLVELALHHGASGYLSKKLSGEDLVNALEHIHQGQVLVSSEEPVHGEEQGRWPGERHGLTVRESELIALITAGLGNRGIAEQTCVTINTVKSYVRSAYRKMGVTTRAQAVLWAIQHGFLAPPVRVYPASIGSSKRSAV
jgi:two-component system, NarL family, response regulator LiaR